MFLLLLLAHSIDNLMVNNNVNQINKPVSINGDTVAQGKNNYLSIYFMLILFAKQLVVMKI